MKPNSERGTLGLSFDPYLPWSPINERIGLSWPGGAPFALAVVVTLESVQWSAVDGPTVPPKLRGEAYPHVIEIHKLSQYEYGNRVGVYRVLEVLRRHGIRPMIAADAAVYRDRPELVQRLGEFGVDFLGHGLTASLMLSEAWSEAEEQEYILQSIDAVENATQQEVRGWMGVEYGESRRTPNLLAQAGIDYVLDWPVDEQPQQLTTESGPLWNLPIAVELDDAITQMWTEGDIGERRRALTPSKYADMIVRQGVRMKSDGRNQPRLLVLNVHPWIIGQPFRIRHFERAISQIVTSGETWTTSGDELVSYLNQRFGS